MRHEILISKPRVCIFNSKQASSVGLHTFYHICCNLYEKFRWVRSPRSQGRWAHPGQAEGRVLGPTVTLWCPGASPYGCPLRGPNIQLPDLRTPSSAPSNLQTSQERRVGATLPVHGTVSGLRRLPQPRSHPLSCHVGVFPDPLGLPLQNDRMQLNLVLMWQQGSQVKYSKDNKYNTANTVSTIKHTPYGGMSLY